MSEMCGNINVVMKLRCLRCGKIHTIKYPDDGVWCDCHEYCDMGSWQLSNRTCIMVDQLGRNIKQYGSSTENCWLHGVGISGSLNWPVGIKQSYDIQHMWDPLHWWAYCTVHNRYSLKAPIYLEVGVHGPTWEEWLNTPSKALRPRQREKDW